MTLSFFDLGLTSRDIPQASADALQAQQSNQLAVAQAPALREAFRQGLQRQQAQHALALGDSRLALGATRLGLQQRELGLKQGAYRYAQAQVPYEIGLGAVSGGVRLAGGYAALQDQERAQALANAQLAAQQEQAGLSRRATASLVDLYAQQRKLLESQQYPLPVTVTPLPVK